VSKVRLNEHGFNRDVSRPGFVVPPLACDAHMHIVGPFDRFPLQETRDLAPPAATAEDFRITAHTLGLSRCVVVQPSFFARDNTCTLASVSEIGLEARAVVVVDPDITEKELQCFHDAGARGVRLQTVVAGGTDPKAARELAAKLAPLGWHIQLFVRQSQLSDLIPFVQALPVPVVFDHMVHLNADDPEDSQEFRLLQDLLGHGRCWVKLSNAFFTVSDKRARLLVETNPDQVMWGSDWPHVAFTGSPPDDGRLLDRLTDWSRGDMRLLERVLCANAGRLYFSRHG
jgi:predicted TIM-barrel fold metal-dependent hydrolase